MARWGGGSPKGTSISREGEKTKRCIGCSLWEADENPSPAAKVSRCGKHDYKSQGAKKLERRERGGGQGKWHQC